jgi:hypothetical protein
MRRLSIGFQINSGTYKRIALLSKNYDRDSHHATPGNEYLFHLNDRL